MPDHIHLRKLAACLLALALLAAGLLSVVSLSMRAEALEEPPTQEEAASPYEPVFDGAQPPHQVSASGTGVLWQSGGSQLSRARSTVEALSVAYLTYQPEPPLVVGQAVQVKVFAQGGDGEYRYKLAVYYNEDPATEFYRSQEFLPFSASPVFSLTFPSAGAYIVHAYIEDSSGNRLVWGDAKLLVVSPGKYSNPEKVAEKVASLASQCRAAAGTPYAKAKWMHDWLVNNADYSPEGQYVYKPEGVLLLGHGVCDCYSQAYQMLMNAVGVPCLYVTHDAGNHAWNLVKLGDFWYHVDVTQDDPRGNAGPNYRYFLVSDDFMRHADFTHSYWNDSAGQVPPCPYNWGEAPAVGPTPAPTAPVNTQPVGFEENGIRYTVMDGEAFVESLVSGSADVVIPAAVKGYAVRGILSEALGFRYMNSVSLPEGLRSIGSEAFTQSVLPTAVRIPASVTHIGPQAFSGMGSTPGFQVAAGSASFASQGGVLFSKDMSRILQYPATASAASYTLPSTVRTIDDGAFSYNSSLKEVHSASAVLEGTVYGFSGSAITVYGKDGTALQADIKRYSNSPVQYVVTGGAMDKQQSQVTILGSLDKAYDGKPVSLPAYTATGDGHVTIAFYELVDWGGTVIDSWLVTPPMEEGRYKAVVTQAEGLAFKGSEASLEFQITGPAQSGLKGDANLDGRVGIEDLASIIAHLVFQGEIRSFENADTSGNGLLEMDDLKTVIEMVVSQ